MVGIYKIENIKNGYVYIGQSVNIERRLKDHKRELKYNRHINNHLQNAYNKYGESNFNFEIICECEKEKLNELETYYCNLYRPNVYNIGETHSVGSMSEEQKVKISKALKGIKRSEKTKEKYRQVKLGKKASDETKLKMSLSQKGHIGYTKGTTHIVSDETKAKISLSNKGKSHIHSEETKKKISETLKNKKIKRHFTEEQRTNMSKAHIGKKRTPEQIEKMMGRIPWNKGMTKEQMLEYKNRF